MWFAIAGLILSAASAAKSSADQSAAGAAQAGAAEYNAKVSRETGEYNARVLTQNAKANADAAYQNAATARMEAEYGARSLRSEAEYAASRTVYDIARREEELAVQLGSLGGYSGVQMTSGSVVANAQDQIRNAVLDEQIIAYEGEMDVWRYNEQASLLLWSGENKANAYEHQGKSLLVQGANEANMARWQGYTGSAQMRQQGAATQAAANAGASSTLLTGLGNTAMNAVDVYDKYKAPTKSETTPGSGATSKGS